MSDESLDLRAEITRIDRDRAEARKLEAEARKLDEERRLYIERQLAEMRKFNAEREKLLVEAQKLARDRWLAPVLAIVSMVGGLLGLATFVARLLP